MKLFLVILLLATATCASSIKSYTETRTINKHLNETTYFGSIYDIPTIHKDPKNLKNIFFYRKGNLSKSSKFKIVIIDKDDKVAWEIGTEPTMKYKQHDYVPFNINHLKRTDPKVIKFLLEENSVKKDDLNIWVKVRNSTLGNPRDFTRVKKKTHEIYSLTQNKYKENSEVPAYYIKRSSYYEGHLEELGFVARIYFQEEDRKKQKVIDKRERKTIKIADEIDQGLILEIKGPLVLVQVKVCTISDSYGLCLKYGSSTKWFKRDQLTFKKQGKK